MNRSDLATRIDELANTPSEDALPSDAESVVDELLNFVSALSHHFKPLFGDGTQFIWSIFQPCIDGRIVPHSAGKPK